EALGGRGGVGRALPGPGPPWLGPARGGRRAAFLGAGARRAAGCGRSRRPPVPCPSVFRAGPVVGLVRAGRRSAPRYLSRRRRVVGDMLCGGARFEEKKFARSPMKDEYAEYLRRTGRFLPRMRTLFGMK